MHNGGATLHESLTAIVLVYLETQCDELVRQNEFFTRFLKVTGALV